MQDELGDRMKSNYEDRTRYLLPRRTYTIVRLDGKAFHSFTKGFDRPFDKDFTKAMDKTALFLAENVQGCQFAYVQSDEISLLLTDFEKPTTDAFFDGNVQKICSVTASLATFAFRHAMGKMDPQPKWFDKSGDYKLATFDSRVFTIPDIAEVQNYFIWRQKDASRNSVNAAAQSVYSHNELEGKSISEAQEMLFQKGINWNDYPVRFKRGAIVKRVESNFVVPAGPNQGKMVTRKIWEVDNDIPIFTQELLPIPVSGSFLAWSMPVG